MLNYFPGISQFVNLILVILEFHEYIYIDVDITVYIIIESVDSIRRDDPNTPYIDLYNTFSKNGTF